MPLKSDCYKCVHRRCVPGDCHSECMKPHQSQAAEYGGAPIHAIRHGWYAYPWNYDPIWRQNECPNYQPREEVKND